MNPADVSSRHEPTSIFTKHQLQLMSNLSYLPGAALEAAVKLAIQMELPLFITGEPGTGKTELAYWIAQNADFQEYFGIGGEVLRFNAKTTSTSKDLLYRYDAIRHFRDSQVGTRQVAVSSEQSPEGGGQLAVGIEQSRMGINVLNYIHFEALGQAIIGARSQRRVVLVDEIDKAPRDFPNDLLFEFDQLGFRIEEATPTELHSFSGWSEMPSLKEMKVEKPPFDEQDFIFFTEKEDRKRPAKERTVKKPVLILTSNSEKNLPDAFLRRCAFFHIEFPGEKRLLEILMAKGLYDENRNKQLVEGALKFFIELREKAGLRRKPATAELIAWVDFLSKLDPPVNPADRLSQADLERVKTTISLLGKNPEDFRRIGEQLKRK